MCGLWDIRHAQMQGDLYLIHEVGDHGEPTIEVGRARRMEPRNLEQWFWRIMNDLFPPAPYQCACGADFTAWPAVMEHCNSGRRPSGTAGTTAARAVTWQPTRATTSAIPATTAAVAMGDLREVPSSTGNEPTFPGRVLRTMKSEACSRWSPRNDEVAHAALSR